MLFPLQDVSTWHLFFCFFMFVHNTIVYAIRISLNDSLPGRCLGVQGTRQFFRVACGEIPRGGIYRMWVSGGPVWISKNRMMLCGG